MITARPRDAGLVSPGYPLGSGSLFHPVNLQLDGTTFMAKYLTAPDPEEKGWPKGVKYIIGNEGCERFSFYGMKSILQVHLTVLFIATGMQDELGGKHAQEMVHLFVAGVYAFPMIGAIIADRLLGKYHTILWLSLVYCLGHLVLSLAENSIEGMCWGLGLIAIGSGGIKPCVSAHVGDQFGKGNFRLVDRVFQAFYFIINFGSFFATLLIPYIRSKPQNIWWLCDHPEYATSVAFAIPGILMFIATIAFWMGRKEFVHVPANPGGKIGLLDSIGATLLFMGFIGLPLFGWGLLSLELNIGLTVVSIVGGWFVFQKRQSMMRDDGFLAVMFHSFAALSNGDNAKAISSVEAEAEAEVEANSIQRNWFFASAAKHFGGDAAEGPRAVLRIISVFFLISVFWALFDQHASSWVRQAKQMNLDVAVPEFAQRWLGDTIPLLPSQIGALNPLMVMALIPFNTFFLYPFITKLGWEMTPLRKMTIGMLMASLAFVVVALIQKQIMIGGEEDMISVMWQFFPYLIMTQAEVMVSITGLEFAYKQAPTRMKSTIMGFWLLSVALGNKLTAVVTALPDMDMLTSFWAFAALMAVAAVLFGIRATFYKGQEHTQ
jgi:POT family proton-dependent oligopeptide transporter